MRVYFEYRNGLNDKCIRSADMDLIVSKFFNVELDPVKYVIPPHNGVSWFDVIEGLFWSADLDCADGGTHYVRMDELIIALEKEQSFYKILDVDAYIILLHLFKEMNLYLYVEYLDSSFLDPEIDNSFRTTDLDKIYKTEDIEQWAETIPCYDKMKENFIR